MNRPLTVGALVARLQRGLPLEQIGAGGLDRPVTSVDVSGPGLVLAGYIDRFPAQRLQAFGETEIAYLASLTRDERERILRMFFGFDLPCVFVTKGQELPQGFESIAGEKGIPIFRTPLKTGEFYRRIKPILDDLFAPTTTLHGSLADVFGVGLFFTGKSGIGK